MMSIQEDATYSSNPSSLIIDNYPRLLSLLYEVGSNIAGKPAPDPRFPDIEHIVQKILLHATTIHKLWSGFSIEFVTIQGEVFDFTSANVIARAGLEAYLTLYYVFIDPSIPGEDFDYRHSAWQLESLIPRQGPYTFPIYESSDIQKLLAEQKQMKAFQDVMCQTKTFKQFKLDKQQSILTSGQHWRPAWSKLADLAGFKKAQFERVYSYLSLYAHSGGITGWQLGNEDKANRQEKFLLGMQVMSIVLGRTIGHY